MIQILGVRHYIDRDSGKEKKTDKFFSNNWKSRDAATILQEWPSFVEKIPENERFNIHFTQFNCTEKKREFYQQWILPFDIDKVDMSVPYEKYLDLLAQILQVERTHLGVIASGHGYHVLVQLQAPFAASYFDEMRPHYNAICSKMNHALATAGLPGLLDPQFFHAGLIGFRMPGTENRKPGQPSVMVKVLQADMVPHQVDLPALSGIPLIAPGDQLEKERHFTVDTPAVLSGCDFLKFVKQEPEKVSYGAWYGALSVLGRCKDGAKLAHEYSKGHPGYNEAETTDKLAQAMQSSGPRTCKNINGLPGWRGKCEGCKNNGKVNSPISIRGEDFVETQDTGFHTIIPGKGKVTRIPNYSDLRKYFDQAHAYKILGESKVCYIWTGTHYKEFADVYLEGYAQERFNPYAHTGMTDEFKKLVCRTNTTDLQWFTDTTFRKINFQNGIYDLGTGELTPHSKDCGFRYVLPYDYDASARAPQFEKFLNEIMCGDQALQNILLEFCGYAFSGDECWTRKVLILAGTGENGKSKFLDLFRAMAGADNYTSWKLSDLKNEQKCQVMDGKLFNLADETSTDSFEDTETIKNLSTGGPMTCRKLYKTVYQIENRTKIISSTNKIPHSKDDSKGFASRFIIVPFKAEFTEHNRDTEILKKLLPERAGIFNLIMEGYARLRKQKKFTSADASDRELEEFKGEIDPTTRWLKERLVLHPMGSCENFIWVRDLYTNYRISMERDGEKPWAILTHNSFGKKVKAVIADSKSRVKPKQFNKREGNTILSAEYLADEIH